MTPPTRQLLSAIATLIVLAGVFVRHYVANTPMRRYLSALVMAVFMVCGALGHSVAWADEVRRSPWLGGPVAHCSLGGFQGLAGQTNLPPNKQRTSGSNQHSETRDYKQPKGPIGHIPLGLKVLLIPLVFVIGFYCLLNAFSHRKTITESTALGYALSGAICIFGGIALASLYQAYPSGIGGAK